MGGVDESALDNLPRPNKRNQFKSLHRQRKQRGLDEQGMAEGDVVPFARPSQTLTWQQVPKDILLLANDWFWASEDNSGLDAVIDPKGYGSGTANNVKYITAKLQQKGWSIDYNDENDGKDEYNLVLTNRRGQSVLLSINDAQSFTGWASGTNPINEGPFVQRIMHPGRVSIYVRSAKVPKLVATDIPYEILDKYIAKVISKYPQFKPSDFSFRSSDKVNENTAPNPRVDLTPNYPNYATLVGEFIGVKKNRVLFRIVSAELKPGQGETEKIFRAMSTNTPIGIDISRVKNRAVLEALKPDAFAALQQAKQRIEQNRQQEVDQWAQDFRANSSKLAGQQLKQRFAEPPPEPPTMPVVQPGESPDALKDRLAQLNIAKQKFEEINALIRAIKKKYQHSAIEAEITAIERRLETGLLPDVRAGVADNYKSLLAKLDNLKTSLTTRFIVKEAPDYIEEGRKI
jgi:hypothetical protein